MREEKILINDLEINYKIAGEGEPLLILHGWGGSSNSWVRVQEILANQGYKVIVPDFPGFGKSKTPSTPWGLDDYKDFILKFTEKVGFNIFFLLGHSFGGRIAIKFTVSYPEKIKKLALCDSAGIKPEPGLKTRITFILARIGNAFFTPKILVRFKDGARNIFYLFLRHKDYAKANAIMKKTIVKILDEDLLSQLSQIKVKTLIVWGNADKMVPVKYAAVFKEKIANAELITLPKIGHSPHLETPEKLAEILARFFKV